MSIIDETLTDLEGTLHQGLDTIDQLHEVGVALDSIRVDICKVRDQSRVAQYRARVQSIAAQLDTQRRQLLIEEGPKETVSSEADLCRLCEARDSLERCIEVSEQTREHLAVQREQLVRVKGTLAETHPELSLAKRLINKLTFWR